MQHIVISDIHQRYTWVKELRALYPEAIFIFLGDYFDRKDSSLQDTKETACWLKTISTDPKNILIMGNHDMYYVTPTALALRDMGFTTEKLDLIVGILGTEFYKKMVTYYTVNNWFFSHAGFNSTVFSNFHKERINIQMQKALALALQNKIPPEFGNYGLTWQKWSSFTPIVGINQVVGHTTFDLPQHLEIDCSDNWCLDTCNQHYGILENNNFRTLRNPFAPVLAKLKPKLGKVHYSEILEMELDSDA